MNVVKTLEGSQGQGWPGGIHFSEDNIVYMPGGLAFHIMVPVSKREETTPFYKRKYRLTAPSSP